MSLNGYTHVFDRSIAKSTSMSIDNSVFEAFRSEKELYGFIDNGDAPPDIEADTIAKLVDPSMYEMYKELLKTRVKLGYANSTSIHSDYTNLDSRHIMMFVILFKNIPQHIDSIIEIGGGFGQWLSLNKHRSFRKWTIIDLPHVSLLQKWYLEKQGVPSSLYETVSAFDYDGWNSGATYDVVIGSHSLSEFSMDVFLSYFNKIVMKCTYFFYCYHNSAPSRNLIQMKLSIIHTKFTPIASIISERGNVTNCLYEAIRPCTPSTNQS